MARLIKYQVITCPKCGKERNCRNGHLSPNRLCRGCSKETKYKNILAPKGTIEQPIVGDIRRGDKTGSSQMSFYMWAECIDCHKPRWALLNKQLQPMRIRCKKCSRPIAQAKNRITQLKPEVKAKHSKAMKLKYLDPIYKERCCKASMLAQNIRPNKPEQQIQIILDELYPHQWQYTGDGTKYINGKNPDFWNGDHKLIEMFGDFWHGKRAETYEDTEEGRTAFFSKEGYKCLIIWEHELKLPTQVASKIIQYVGTCQSKMLLFNNEQIKTLRHKKKSDEGYIRSPTPRKKIPPPQGMIEHPIIGDIRRGDEFGKTHGKTQYRMWSPCSDCGVPRWVQINSKLEPEHIKCHPCSCKITGKLMGYANKKELVNTK